MAVATIPTATVRYGNEWARVPYTPSGAAVVAGQVVLVGDLPLVSTRPIPDGELGALVAGGVVFKVTGDAAISAGKKVYWDNTNKKVTETVGTNKLFGVTVSACTGDDSTCDVLHTPTGPDAT